MSNNSELTPDGYLSERISRRAVVLGVGALALGPSITPAFAAAENVVRVGFISPRTGPLGIFGKTDGHILDLVRTALKDGLKVGDTTFEVKIIDADTQSDPSRAGQLAKSLINGDGVDLMLAISTPETVNPVSDACEAAGVPCLSTVMPWEAWYYGRGAKPGAPSPFKWTYHFSFGIKELFETMASQWKLIETNKRVGMLLPNDADGNAVRAHLVPLLSKAGFTIIDPGPYEDGTTDFAAQIALFKKEKCEIFNSFPIPPDFAAFWRQAAQQGYAKTVKICQAAKVGLFPDTSEALGALGDKLAAFAYWHKTFPYKSSLTGISGTELADGYEKSSGKQWTQQLGATLSLFDAGIEALKASNGPKDKGNVAKAISTLKTMTIIGSVDFTSGPVPNVSPGPNVGAQWIKSKKGSKFPFELVLTENATDPKVPVGGILVPYNV
jgi:branched-chain amino acid transport system substrate-binding protein